MRKMHSLHPHDSALTRTFKKIDFKSFFLKIQKTEQEFFKIAVVSAVNQNQPLAFSVWLYVHHRKFYVLIRHFKFFNPSAVSVVREKIRIVFIKKFRRFFVIRFFVGVAVVHKKFAHAVIGNRIFNPLLFHGLVTKRNKLAFPIFAVVDF